MNCPTCGARNDKDALFCAECGTPLENQDIEATIASGKFMLDADDAATILADPDQIDTEAKTVAVDQDKLNAALTDPGEAEYDPFDPSALPSAPSVSSMPPMSPPPIAEPVVAAPAEVPATASVDAGYENTVADKQGGGSKKTIWIVAGVLVLLFILCCCCSSLVVGSVLGDPETLEDIIRELSAAPFLTFVV